MKEIVILNRQESGVITQCLSRMPVYVINRLKNRHAGAEREGYFYSRIISVNIAKCVNKQRGSASKRNITH